MILRVPYYYDKFSCIADKCKHSCCEGWEIDIDERSSEYYKNLEGPFGDRLRDRMQPAEDGDSFILNKGRCPFLNDKNLCDIITEIGEESICETCTDYPRFSIIFGNIMERCLGLSCEEAGRIIFGEEEPFSYVEREFTEDRFKVEDDSDDSDEWKYFEMIRDHALKILQKREEPFYDRLLSFLAFSYKAQEYVNYNKLEEVPDWIKGLTGTEKEELSKDTSRFKENLEERFERYENLEIMDGEWSENLKHLKDVLLDPNFSKDQYDAVLNEFLTDRVRTIEWEQIVVYFTFRYFMKAVYDSRIFSKAQFAISSFLIIRDMDVVRFLDKKGNYTKEDRVDVARIYCKEVEHSEENMEILSEDFDFEDIFSLQELINQI